LHCFFPQAKKNVEVKKVHETEYQNNQSYFNTQFFYHLLHIGDSAGNLQCVYCIAKVYKIKAHQQQVVYTLRQFFVAMKNIDEKHFSVFKQCPGHPNCEADGDQQIKAVSNNDVIHKL